MREIVFDTETTGIHFSEGHRMVEIGCVELVGRVPTGATFHRWFNPGRDMPVEAERVHGLSAAFLADKPVFADEAAELLAFLGDDAPLVAHNASFDFGFLNGELAQCGLPVIDTARMVDTVAIARRKHPGAKLSLDALCTRYGIDRSHRILHGALLDAELLAQLYVELTGGRQIGLELAAEAAAPGPAAAKAGSAPASLVTVPPRTDRPFRPARPHRPSEAERARHAEFMAGFSNPLWSQ